MCKDLAQQEHSDASVTKWFHNMDVYQLCKQLMYACDIPCVGSGVSY